MARSGCATISFEVEGQRVGQVDRQTDRPTETDSDRPRPPGSDRQNNGFVYFFLLTRVTRQVHCYAAVPNPSSKTVQCFVEDGKAAFSSGSR